jgi:hypothetical protein
MRMRLIVALLMGLAAPLQAGTTPAATAPRAPTEKPTVQPQADPWLRSGATIILRSAGIGFPTAPGGMPMTGSTEFTHKGEYLDNAIEYKGSDGAVWATAYLFYPGLAHTGLSAFASEIAIKSLSKGNARLRRSQIVAAGGKPGVALLNDYDGYVQGRSSSAAFVKVGRWMVAFRVSGPPARQNEVDATMRALLDGLVFDAADPPRAAAPLSTVDCPADAGRTDAHLLADPKAPQMAAHAILGAFDGGGIEARDSRGGILYLPSRIAPRLCVSILSLAKRTAPVLRAEAGAPTGVDGRTRLVVVISDGGDYLELIEHKASGGYVLIRHEIGASLMLGTYDGIPSDTQLAAVLSGIDDESNRIRARVTFRPKQSTRISVLQSQSPPPPAVPAPHPAGATSSR